MEAIFTYYIATISSVQFRVPVSVHLRTKTPLPDQILQYSIGPESWSRLRAGLVRLRCHGRLSTSSGAETFSNSDSNCGTQTTNFRPNFENLQ